MHINDDERGQALVFVAFSMVIMLLIIGFAIDFGRAFLARTQLQNMVDAAVLAGASEHKTRLLFDVDCVKKEEVYDPDNDKLIEKCVKKQVEETGRQVWLIKGSAQQEVKQLFVENMDLVWGPRTATKGNVYRYPSVTVTINRIELLQPTSNCPHRRCYKELSLVSTASIPTYFLEFVGLDDIDMQIQASASPVVTE